MRKFLIPIAVAAPALTVAVPASAQYAQWAPPVYQYNPYNFGNSFRGANFARSMAAPGAAYPHRHPCGTATGAS